MRTNEEILEEWHKVAVKEFHVMEQYQYLVSKWWLSQRLQDLQAIKEMALEVKNCYLTADKKSTDIELGAQYAINGFVSKLDELMK